MKELKNISLMTIFLNKLKNKELEFYFFRQYLLEIVKYNFSFSIDIMNFIKLEKKIIFQSLDEMNDCFEGLTNKQVSYIFNKFPAIKPKKLIFLTELVNGKYIYLNKAIYTEFLGIDKQSCYINFLAFNIENQSIKITEFDLDQVAFGEYCFGEGKVKNN